MMTAQKVPFLNLNEMHQPIKAEMLDAFERFYDSGWYVLGNEVASFEKMYAEFNQVNYSVGVSNGLDALILSLKALGIQEGDEVIVPSNTYIATWLAVSHVGAKPVPVEPDIETYNIDPSKISASISAKTKAILPVHLYGQCCQMDEIMAIAEKYHLKLVEDNAQSHLATYNGKLTGSFGHINATSFYPGKNLGAMGDAGAITTDDKELAENVAVLRNYGSKIKYYNEVPGYNMRLDECHAALLKVKLKYLKAWTEQRCEIAGWYHQLLHSTGDLILPVCHPNATHVYHVFVIRTGKRDALKDHLQQHGIGTLVHYPVAPHLQKAYGHLHYQPGDFPLAEEIADTSISLPLYPGMKYEQVEYVSQIIKQFY